MDALLPLEVSLIVPWLYSLRYVGDELYPHSLLTFPSPFANSPLMLYQIVSAKFSQLRRYTCLRLGERTAQSGCGACVSPCLGRHGCGIWPCEGFRTARWSRLWRRFRLWRRPRSRLPVLPVRVEKRDEVACDLRRGRGQTGLVSSVEA